MNLSQFDSLYFCGKRNWWQ